MNEALRKKGARKQTREKRKKEIMKERKEGRKNKQMRSYIGNPANMMKTEK